MTATTQSKTTTYTPSRRALAARSLRAVDKITDPDQRRTAFARHMAQFEPVIGRRRVGTEG